MEGWPGRLVIRSVEWEHTKDLLLVDGLNRIAIHIAIRGAITELWEIRSQEGVWKVGSSGNHASEKTKRLVPRLDAVVPPPAREISGVADCGVGVQRL